jgi:sigma-E factor negative regulatory protein RseC
MNRNQAISHEAIVKSVDNGSVTVSFSPGVSCSGCRAERSCGISGNSERIFKVDGSFDLHPGEQVVVSIKGSQGYLALFLGYLLPLILVVSTLVILSSLRAGELVSGLSSFGILIPYYIILWIFRRFVGNRFSFTIKTAI